MKLAVAVAIASLSVPAFAGQPCNLCDLKKEIDRVDKEDMRVKRGAVHGDTLTLRVEDQAKTRGRKQIYGKDVHIDVSSLEESAEIAAGDASVLAAAQSHADYGDSVLHEKLVQETDARIEGDYQSYLHTESVAQNLREADGLIRESVYSVQQDLAGVAHDVSGLASNVDTLYNINRLRGQWSSAPIPLPEEAEDAEA